MCYDISIQLHNINCVYNSKIIEIDYEETERCVHQDK